MKVLVRFIGRYKEVTGVSDLELDVLSGDTMWSVLDMLIQRYPALEKDKKFMLISKNGVFATRDTMIMAGDQITVAPPVVSGG